MYSIWQVLCSSRIALSGLRFVQSARAARTHCSTHHHVPSFVQVPTPADARTVPVPGSGSFRHLTQTASNATGEKACKALQHTNRCGVQCNLLGQCIRCICACMPRRHGLVCVPLCTCGMKHMHLSLTPCQYGTLPVWHQTQSQMVSSTMTMHLTAVLPSLPAPPPPAFAGPNAPEAPALPAKYPSAWHAMERPVPPQNASSAQAPEVQFKTPQPAPQVSRVGLGFHFHGPPLCNVSAFLVVKSVCQTLPSLGSVCSGSVWQKYWFFPA
jgi:hypothetical protein